MPFLPSFSKDLGIDLGTIQTRIANSTGILVDEPTVVAIVIEEQKMVEFGKAAGDMAGRVQSAPRWRVCTRSRPIWARD